MTAFTPPLTWDVYVTALEPTVSDDLPPGARQRLFSPTAATLICGERDAVLVDAPLTVGQARAPSDRIAAHGKHLTAIYLTPGHGDRWLGLSVILERFADARAFALPSVIAQMHQGSTPEFLATFWEPLFPGKLPEQLVLPDPLPDHTLMLEGRNLVAVELEHTDTDATSWLHVPEIGLVVAGDAASNDVLLYLAESSPARRRDWLAALDTIEALQPRAVIAGHQRAGRHDGPELIEETRRYIRDFDRLAARTSTALDLYEQMLALYPARVNPGTLWSSARALKG